MLSLINVNIIGCSVGQFLAQVLRFPTVRYALQDPIRSHLTATKLERRMLPGWGTADATAGASVRNSQFNAASGADAIASPAMQTRFLPRDLASYTARSATRISASPSWTAGWADDETPMLAVT